MNEWLLNEATHNQGTHSRVATISLTITSAAARSTNIVRSAAMAITAAAVSGSRSIELARSAVAGIAASATGSRTLELARSAAAGIAAAVSIGWTNGIYLLVRLGIYDYAHSRPAILRANVFVKAITTAYHKMIAKIFRGNI